ncbi:hypothetical protein [Rheinheimera baltica]|uniref:hypothetical protein n=1 Tax=Rheinheimera baltica TaxID=67576 RepID=UPI0003F8D458|nr:hypothetical protein [Rheinheimera baltica]
MTEQKTQLPPSPEQMALDITTALISAGILKGTGLHDMNNADSTMRYLKRVYEAALKEFKKV